MSGPQTSTTPISNASTTAFRAWVLEMTTKLAAAGLTQTADTGQINPATVTVPSAINQIRGYQIWRFNDTLQATAPIFLKLEYGSNSAIAYPLILITLGQGSNGAGTLTGTLTTRVACTSDITVQSTSANYPSYWNYNATYGFLGCAWKFGSSSLVGGAAYAPYGGFYVGRSNDSAGAATGDAVFLWTPSSTAAGNYAQKGGCMQIYSWLTNTVYPPALDGLQEVTSTQMPFQPASTVSGANVQVVPSYLFTPNIQFSNLMGCCVPAEIPVGTTFNKNIIGATALTYLSVGYAFNSVGVCVTGSYYGYMLWQ